MRFEDEHYVKLYTRDTPTWKAMCWQAKALLPLLFRKLDAVGTMDCADLGRVETVAVMTDLPPDVVEPGLKSLERLKVLVWRRNNVLLEPRFIEAQEARKTDKLRKQEEREKSRALLAAQESGILDGASEAVQSRPLASESVTLSHSPTSSPSPASTPSPSQNIAPQPSAARPDLQLVGETEAKKRRPSEAEAFWEWAQLQRLKLPGLVEDARPKDPTTLNTWFKRALQAVGTVERLRHAFARYVAEDDYWRAKGVPFQAFTTESVWRKHSQTLSNGSSHSQPYTGGSLYEP